ncbi:MAG: U32 family peptidase, partial [Clostridia bacterium]|nr:U32 family peptidase [Clostridia bacterium]
MINKKPELLAPAGSLDKLKMAVLYGADAVYLGGVEFSMRTASKNFNDEELIEGISFAHERGVKVYVAINIVPRSSEIEKLPQYLEKLSKYKADGVIVTDMGVLECVKKYAPDLEIHISTQANITNYQTANAFYNMGARRVVLARELTLEEIKEIRNNIPEDMEIECFIHGAM